MAAKTILVPVDFSKSSEAALDQALRLARENGGKLLLVHVITDSARHVPIPLRASFYSEIQSEARRKLEQLLRRKKIRSEDLRLLIVRDADPARVIADQAKRSRASMVVMGSRGRTGLSRLVLGSVAEKALRRVECPILIVKE